MLDFPMRSITLRRTFLPGILWSFFCMHAEAQNVEAFQGINHKISQIVLASAQPGEVQVATLPAVVEWNDRGGRFQFYSLCDALPAWGPEIKASGLSLSLIYYAFLTGVQASEGNAEADKKQREIAAEAKKVYEEYERERLSVLDNWNKVVAAERNLPEDQKTAYATFMEKAGASLAGLEISFISVLTKWQPLVAKAAPSTVGYSLNKFLSLGSRVKVKTYSGAETNVLDCSPGVELAKELEGASKQYEEKKGKADLTLQFSRRTGEKRESWENWGYSSGWGPFAVSVNGTRYEIKTTDSNFALSLEIPKVLRFSIERPWLNLTLVNTYRDAPILPKTELAKMQPLWGPKGTFPLVPLEFVVAYRPRARVTMSQEDYSFVKTTIGGGGSFGFGPIRVGGGGSGGSLVEKWDDTSNTVVVGTSAEAFVLLAIRNRIMP